MPIIILHEYLENECKRTIKKKNIFLKCMFYIYIYTFIKEYTYMFSRSSK